ncbi:hypothetical protein [Bartonella rattimassiliensis]|uniref:Uncharacterized protein n=1 Tax=Bartonella rattimassiliensis 15908 TaxID=1094556 RepID=J1JS84_9HYPH|nr:hypothetical protein [Bartonella rattimassiliensis]EJF87722.1 hypothetical protein MCY_00176 [Bartonella rattimassiliensis 15908]
MSYKELFICISTAATASFTGSVTETAKCGAQMPSYLPDSYESAVKDKYKLPLYKLWQYATKNKPSRYNDGVVHHNNKRYPNIQRLFTSYRCLLKRFLQLKVCIKQAPLIESERVFWLKSSVFFRKLNNIGWPHMPYFIHHINFVDWIFAYIRIFFRKEKINNHKKVFVLNSFIAQIYKIKGQQQESAHRTGTFINQTLHNKVYY